MKSENIVKKLQKEGYNIIYKKWSYWDGVPHVRLDGYDFTIAKIVSKNNWQACRIDFIYNEVRQALYIAEKNNPIILKKTEKDLDYGKYLILSMGDYYLYKKNIYPFDNYYKVIDKLKNELV